MAERAVRSAARRRERWLRSMWRHEQHSVRMAVATATHHSWKSHAVVGTQTEYVGPACTTATITTGVNLDVTGVVHPHFSSSAVDGSASQVVGLLPLGDVFVAPVFNQVHQEQLAGGEAFSRVAHSLPPEELTVPVYSLFHQEQFSAGETTENIAYFPVVQEHVLVQAIPRLVGSSPPVDEFTAHVAMRPLPLVEVQPSERAQRHAVEGLGEFAPMVQILDAPVPQMVDYVAQALRLLDRSIAEQVITVPTVSCASCPSRSRVPEPQSADQFGGSADRPDSHAHRFADRGADRRHSSPSWSCSWFPPRTEFLLCLCRNPLSGWNSLTPMAGFTSGTDAPVRLSGRHRLASEWSGLVQGMRLVGSGSGTGLPVSPLTLSHLFLQSEELHRQPSINTGHG